MLKGLEKAEATSCWNKAKDNERMFILLARDKAAPGAIRHWVMERVRLGLNKVEDPKIREAMWCADLMEEERKNEERKNEERKEEERKKNK